MSFEADLKSHLGTDGTVAGIVGERIYPVIRPEGTGTPALTYQRVAGVPQNSLDGFTSGLTAIRVQIDCWGKKHAEIIALAKAVRDRMATAASSFKAVMTLDQDFYEDDARVYRVMMDFNCWFRE